jgi:hypothetical protein
VSAVLRSSRRTPPSPTRAPRRSRRSRAAARGPARRRLPVTDNSRALPPVCREGQAFRRRRFRRYSPPQGAPPTHRGGHSRGPQKMVARCTVHCQILHSKSQGTRAARRAAMGRGRACQCVWVGKGSTRGLQPAAAISAAAARPTSAISPRACLSAAAVRRCSPCVVGRGRASLSADADALSLKLHLHCYQRRLKLVHPPPGLDLLHPCRSLGGLETARGLAMGGKVIFVCPCIFH